MYLFLLLVLPCLIVIYNHTIASYSIKELIPAYTIGFLSGIVLCTIKLFFIFSNHIWTTIAPLNFLFLYTHEIFLPCVVLFGAFLICTIKTDDLTYRIKSFYPLIMSFLCVFIPYEVISTQQQKVFFMIFVKPMLFASIIYILSELVFLAYKAFSIKMTKTGITISLFAVLFSVLPSLTETIWYHKAPTLVTIILSLFQILLPALYVIFIKNSKPVLKLSEEMN